MRRRATPDRVPAEDRRALRARLRLHEGPQGAEPEDLLRGPGLRCVRAAGFPRAESQAKTHAAIFFFTKSHLNRLYPLI